MKRFFELCVCVSVLFSCDKGFAGSDDTKNTVCEGVFHDMIVLGDRLENPYTTENVREAFDELYPMSKARDEITTTNLYVRFLPADESEYMALAGTGIELLDHPVDYSIIREGDYYHDPSIPEGNYTWQYAVVPFDFEFPDIRYEIIDECFLADNSEATRSFTEIDWDAVERKSYEMTGNENMLADFPDTRAAKTNPSGRISIIDKAANGGKPFGVAGVRVMCNTFVKFSSTYTDRDGYYTIPKKFSANVRYRLVFKNEKNFAIGFNLILVPASVSTLGKGSPDGVSITINEDSDRKLFCRSAVNNAAYEYMTRCSEEDLDIKLPPGDLRIWLFNGLSASSSIMIHHGVIVERDYLNKYLDMFASLVKFFAPDITIGTKDQDDYMSLYDSVCHELAHASHYSQAGKEYWEKYIFFILKSFVTSGGMTYGSGDEENAGLCEVGEMWAYYLESLMHKDRYGGTMPSFGTSFWFYPQIFRALDERGISAGEIFDALRPEVTTREDLELMLKSMYPYKRMTIEQIFNRYK